MRPKGIRPLAQEHTVKKRQTCGQSRESEQVSGQEVGIGPTDGSRSRFITLVVWLWASHYTSLSLRFLICKIVVVIIVCILLGFVMLKGNYVCKVHSIVLGRCSNLSVVKKSRIENRDKGKMGRQRPLWVGSDIADNPGDSWRKDLGDPVVSSWGWCGGWGWPELGCSSLGEVAQC